MTRTTSILKRNEGPGSLLITALVASCSSPSRAGADGRGLRASNYVIGQDGYVVVHQGSPVLGPWGVSHSIEVTDIALKDLSPWTVNVSKIPS